MSRIAHLSDLHLGIVQYAKTTAGGQNQRTADVMDTFTRAVDAVVALKPDVILVAGDVFHMSAPHYSTAYAACRQFARLAKVAPVVCVEGNHDEPHEPARGAAIWLLRQHGVMVATSKVERFAFGDVSIMAVPECVAEQTAYEPDGCNVLLLHAAIKNTQQGYGVLEPERLNADRWRYIALGDFHTHRRVVPNGWYSGSLDYTSPDLWREVRTGTAKGFVIQNLATDEHEFHPVETRAFVDLEPIQAALMSPAEVDAAISERVDSIQGGVTGKVVRLKILDIQKTVARALNHRAIRKLKSTALHFQLDPRRPNEVDPWRDASARTKSGESFWRCGDGHVFSVAAESEPICALCKGEYDRLFGNDEPIIGESTDYDDAALFAALGFDPYETPAPKGVMINGIETHVIRKDAGRQLQTEAA